MAEFLKRQISQHIVSSSKKFSGALRKCAPNFFRGRGFETRICTKNCLADRGNKENQMAQNQAPKRNFKLVVANPYQISMAGASQQQERPSHTLFQVDIQTLFA